jgi:hypothetical protein
VSEATNEGGGGVSQTLRKLALPAAVSVAGGAAGLLLTKKGSSPGVKERLSDLGEAGADLGDDLKHKLESVIGRDHGEPGTSSGGGAQPSTRDAKEIESNRREREKRRAERRKAAR